MRFTGLLSRKYASFFLKNVYICIRKTSGKVKERINTGRQVELDVAKVFAILYMVTIHVYEEMSVVRYWTRPDSLFRGVLEFVGGPLAAPVFMFAMGVGMVYTKHRTPRDFAMRGLRLLLAAYLLNVIRMTIPFYLARLSGDSWGYWTVVDTIGLIDILQFAGMAFLLTALLEKWRAGRWVILAVALVLQGVGTVFLHSFDGLPSVAQYSVGLFFHTNPNVSFPLTLWYVFPSFGICFGEYLQTVADKKTMYDRIALLSAAGLLGLSIGMRYMGWNLLDNFALAGEAYYIQHLPQTLWTLCVIGLQLFVCFRISLVLPKSFARGAEYISRRLNTIYLIQWVIIPYAIVAMGAAGLPMLPAWGIVPAGLLIAATSVLLSRYIRFKL